MRQPKRFGVEILQEQAATGLIVATGSTYRRLEAPGEEELLGAGVHFCAETLDPAALFVFVGLSPNVDWLPDEIERSEHGFLFTDKTLQTSIPGVFAARDVRHGATNQAASAAGEGATVALMVREYLEET